MGNSFKRRPEKTCPTTMVKSGQRRVLIAMDGSKHSNYAFDWYVHNVKRSDDFVMLVHCAEMDIMWQSPTFAMGPVSTVPNMVELLDAENNRIQAMAKKLKSKMMIAEVSGKVLSVFGTAGETIVEVAEKEQADLIVTGTRGLGTVRRTFLGSVSDFVLHHSPVPVLVCRQDERTSN